MLSNGTCKYMYLWLRPETARPRLAAPLASSLTYDRRASPFYPSKYGREGRDGSHMHVSVTQHRSLAPSYAAQVHKECIMGSSGPPCLHFGQKQTSVDKHRSTKHQLRAKRYSRETRSNGGSSKRRVANPSSGIDAHPSIDGGSLLPPLP